MSFSFCLKPADFYLWGLNPLVRKEVALRNNAKSSATNVARSFRKERNY
jgi:hypothetical protein